MTVLYSISLIIFLLLILAYIVFICIQFIAIFTTNAPFVPIPKGLEDEIIEHLNLTSDSILYDLGCGDGRVLIQASKKYPGMKAVGVEIAHWPYFLAKFHSRKYKNVQIRRENIFKTDLKDASHIFLYLYPKVINELIGTIEKQCKPGTIILSCDFELTNKAPEKVIDTENTSNPVRGKKLFLYKL